MRNPVLVRVMPDGEVSSNIGDISNTQGGLALNATEQANNDARRIDLPNLQFAPDGGVSQATVRQFVQAMPTSEQGGLIDTNGIPTRQAVDRVNAAIFAKAYGNDGLVRLFAQAQDPEARLILSALAQVAPDMARLDGVGDLDIRDIVAQAAEIAVNARRDGRTIADAAAQLDLTTDAGVMAVLDLFARYPRQSKPVAQALQRAAQFAYQEANKPANDMFGSVPRASRQDVINQLQEQGYGNQQTGQTDLGQQGGRQLDGQDAIGRSTDRARPADAGAVETNRAAGTEPAARAEPDARAAYSGYAGQLDDSGRPLKWRTSKGAATLVANELGIDVAGLTGKEIVAAIEAHDAQPQALTSYDAADLQERDAQQQAADKAEQAEQKRLEDKAKADSQRGEFTLTGGDRAADVGTAAGQQGLRFSVAPKSQSAQEKNLIAQHNLTARALLHAVKMGGLPVPSVAITKVDSPLDNFGELTLIGDVSMIDPKAGGGAKVFGADIYSPRYPATELNLSKDTIKRAQELLADGMQATRKRHIEFAEIERDKGRALAQEPAFMWQFLQKRGVVPNVPANASSHDVYLELKQQIRDAELEDALLADAERFLEDLDADERIFNGYSAQGNRRYIPHTLDNLVKLMKKNLRGGEGVNYGTGSLRAQFAPQFKSVEQIRKAKDKLVTEADFASIKQDIDAEFWKSAETISKDISGSTAVSIMEDAAKIGVQQAASNYGITVDDAAAAKVEDFLAKLRNLPTKYFEAKITRAVSLSEFAAAVVPEDASAEVMQALRDAGIDNIRTYVRNDAASRKQAIQAATAERDGLRFSQSPQKSVEANIRRGRAAMQRALLEKADQHRAMFRNGLGWVDFVWDDAKKGIQHLLERRQDADGMTLAQAKRFVLEDVVAAIAQGQEVRRTEVGKALRVTVAHNNVEAILVRRTGTNAWVLTAFEVLPDPNVRSATQALGTQSTPIRSRHELAGSANSLALGGQHGNTATPADVQAIKSAATAAVGQKRAAKVDVLTRDEVGKRSGLERLMGVTKAQQEAEGYFDPATGQVVLVADNIKEVKTKAGKVVMTREQRAAYVAWHELTHRALAAKGQAVDGVAYGVHYNAVIDGAGSNATVRALANAIHTERKGEISHALAVEEAMATLRPMIKSGDYAALQELYGVAVPKGMQAGLRGAFERFVQGMRRLIARITGADTAQWDDAQVFEVLAGLDRYDTARYEGEGAGGRFSTAPQPQVASGKQGNAWQAPEPTRFDDVVYQLQNKHVDLKRVIESIEKAHGAPLDDAFNPLQKEELYHGMAAKRTQMFEIDELQPLLKTMTRLGVEMDAVEEYLHARHAQEANAVIAARNPDNPNLADGGSGISNAAAKAYFAKLAPANKARLKTRCCKPWQRSISKKAFTPIAAYAHALPSDLGSRSACPKASDKAGATQF